MYPKCIIEKKNKMNNQIWKIIIDQEIHVLIKIFNSMIMIALTMNLKQKFVLTYLSFNNKNNNHFIIQTHIIIYREISFHLNPNPKLLNNQLNKIISLLKHFPHKDRHKKNK